MKKALVTGASEGIGRAFAQSLAREGYEVTAVARSEARLSELVKELGAGHRYLVQDLSKPESWSALSEEFKKTHYDLLINNAGYSVYGHFSETTLPALQQMTRLNCDALVALSHSFLTSAQKGDALINVGSVLSFMPMPTNGLYAATKAFVLSLSESLWFEQKSKGIFVLAVCPGTTATHFHTRAAALADGPNKFAKEPPAFMSQTPEQVVAETMKALKRRSQPTLVSGLLNRITVLFFRFLPQKIAALIMGNVRKA